MSAASTTGGAAVQPPKKRRTGLIIGIIAAVVVAAVAAALIVLNLPSAAKWGTEERPVKLGTVGAKDPYWTTFKEAALAEGIHLEIVDFAEYPQPNPALARGDIDVNQFQHIVYLGAHEASTGDGLVPIGATAIYPLGLYSLKHGSVDEIPAGSTVAIPNDPSNLARGLLVLQSAGLITIEGGGSIFATLDQIDTANSKVTVKAVDANLTVTLLNDPEVSAAIINNDFVKNATKADGTPLAPADAIAQDDPSDANALPYVNIFAAKAADKDDPVLLKLVEIYQSTQSILDGVQSASGGTAVFLKTPVADLEASLVKVTADYKAQG